jgi:acyl phosphate:glycerol-3-phosphate acyltransferase
LGVLLAISPTLALATLLTWGLVFAISKFSSLSAIVAAMMAPVYAWFLLDQAYQDFEMVVVFVSLMLVWRHRTNIKKLINGTEAGFGKKKH